MTMQELAVGQRATITSVGARGPIRARLFDLGFTQGSDVSCLFAAPFGDPRAYFVRGTVVALRAADAARISVSGREAFQ